MRCGKLAVPHSPSEHRQGGSVRSSPLTPPLASARPGLDLLARFSEGKRLGLRKDVRQQHFVEATRDLDPAETLFIISSKT